MVAAGASVTVHPQAPAAGSWGRVDGPSCATARETSVTDETKITDVTDEAKITEERRRADGGASLGADRLPPRPDSALSTLPLVRVSPERLIGRASFSHQ